MLKDTNSLIFVPLCRQKPSHLLAHTCTVSPPNETQNTITILKVHTVTLLISTQDYVTSWMTHSTVTQLKGESDLLVNTTIYLSVDITISSLGGHNKLISWWTQQSHLLADTTVTHSVDTTVSPFGGHNSHTS